ncbi:MAG TPA: glycosyltransferase family 2 protein [Armatimonadota bacterium]|nr:glycosyltransferase family 2 protein [Armatimonadota bacterium]HPP76349.1 glycosyltransferase family 2 protein [Armatimonadota bacterium]
MSEVLKVAAIVPAYNEAGRIGKVLEAIAAAALVDEVLVVNDGSTDDTSAAASQYSGIRLLELPENLGKGGAMYEGACNTDADIVLFLDADLIGLTGEKIDSIIKPVVDNRVDMSIGVFRGGRFITDWAQIIAPYISGQRAIRRELFLQLPNIKSVRSGVEVAMTRYFRANGFTMGTVVLTGCTHVMKEEKLGCIRGLAARVRMYCDIVQTLIHCRSTRARKSVIIDLNKGSREPGTGNR